MHVVATAGHVDHGKSTLIRALTGMEPDRWAEERRRGMTIDLGFAWTTLPSGAEIAFVDVPGHARFIGNMLAGVGPVPAVLVVVAADEGWRAQTEEHVAALDAFGVRHGMLAVTRCDLADPRPAMAHARARLRRTSFSEVPAVAVSGVTGAGLADVRTALDELVAGLPAPDRETPLRLWVDRVFAVRGAGTVVTGTLGTGTLRLGDELRVEPGGAAVRVRGLQTLHRRVDAVAAVARVAVNVRGVDRDELRRGQALVAPGGWLTPDVVDVELYGAASLPARVLVHAGSAAVAARVRPLGPGLARIALAAPLPLRPGERVLVRDPGRHDVLVGSRLLDVAPPPLRRRGAAARRAEELRGMGATPNPAAELARRRFVRRRDLVVAGVLGADSPAPSGAVEAGEWLVAATTFAGWRERLLAAVDERTRTHPVDPGLPAEAARHAVGAPDAVVVDALVASSAGALAVEAGRIVRSGTRPALPPDAAAAVERIRVRLRAAPFAAPDADELTAAVVT